MIVSGPMPRSRGAVGSRLVCTAKRLCFGFGRAGQSEHGGPLSLKTVRSGQTVYLMGKREYAVVPGRILLVPPGERYTTHIGANIRRDSGCLPPAAAAQEESGTATRH